MWYFLFCTRHIHLSSLWMKLYCVTIQAKAIEQYRLSCGAVVLYKLIHRAQACVPFEESYRTVLSTFKDYGRNSSMKVLRYGTVGSQRIKSHRPKQLVYTSIRALPADISYRNNRITLLTNENAFVYSTSKYFKFLYRYVLYNRFAISSTIWLCQLLGDWLSLCTELVVNILLDLFHVHSWHYTSSRTCKRREQ